MLINRYIRSLSGVYPLRGKHCWRPSLATLPGYEWCLFFWVPESSLKLCQKINSPPSCVLPELQAQSRDSRQSIIYLRKYWKQVAVGLRVRCQSVIVARQIGDRSILDFQAIKRLVWRVKNQAALLWPEVWRHAAKLQACDGWDYKD